MRSHQLKWKIIGNCITNTFSHTTIFLRDTLKLPCIAHLYPIHLCVQNSPRNADGSLAFRSEPEKAGYGLQVDGILFPRCSNCWMKRRWWNTFAWWLLCCYVMDMLPSSKLVFQQDSFIKRLLARCEHFYGRSSLSLISQILVGRVCSCGRGSNFCSTACCLVAISVQE